MKRAVLAGLAVLAFGCTPRTPGPPDGGPPAGPGGAAALAGTVEVDLDSLFAGLDGTFVLLDLDEGDLHVYRPERAERRFVPASTFKIVNTLVALETGVASGPTFGIPEATAAAEPEAWWPRSWRGDQTLASAFRNSVVWAYRDLARRIGPERMGAFLAQFGYGNQSLGGGVDRFWLEGDLRISPLEQVAFLQRLDARALGVSDRSAQIVRDLMVLETTEAYRLSGKTGTANVTATRELGWLVGFVESEGARYAYALNLEGDRVWEDYPPHRRASFVVRILRALEAIPAF